MDISGELFELQDFQYKAFQSKLIPNINPKNIIGVRTPELKKLAKMLKWQCDTFLETLPHKYYEENNLHVFIVNEIKNFDECVNRIENFLPQIDNWATCDGLRPVCFAKNREKLLPYIYNWLESGKTYTVRFAIEMLMIHYLDEDFIESCLEKVSLVKSEEYYVNMMIAWYFTTALAKRYDETIVYIESGKLPKWVHTKTIQKSVESFRITEDKKQYIQSLRRKI